MHAPRSARLTAAALLLVFGAPGVTRGATRKRRGDDSDPSAGYTDPRRRELPPMHRFRLGLEVFYVRLDQATGPNGNQQFHLAPLGIDLAYQLQFAKRLMIRPAFAVAVNVANSFTAMPVHLHPKLHFGYQGALLGAALGYGYFTPIVYHGDAEDPIRGGYGQPILLHNHHVDLELSLTTRVDRGALSFAVRGGMENGQLWHFDRNGERLWRPMFTFNMGWYFGYGRANKTRAGRSRTMPRP